MGLFSFLKKKESGDLPIICKCKKISEKTIVEAIKNGANTVEKVKSATGAGTGMCGGKRCIAEVERLIAENK
jgi:bacterioferritin-associated ferredoxin